MHKGNILVEKWRAHFRDNQHDMVTTIENIFCEENEAYALRIVIDGIAFSGMSFDGLELENERDFNTAQTKFSLLKRGSDPNCSYELQGYSLSIEIPVQVVSIVNRETKGALICFTFSREEDMEKDLSIVYSDLVCCRNFSMIVDDDIYICDNPNPNFELSLLQICSKIKGKYYLKCCFGCLYSDYSPYGNSDFATMLCFVSRGEEYTKVSSKMELWNVHDDGVQKQETYLCNHFCPRIDFPGGYRGQIY